MPFRHGNTYRALGWLAGTVLIGLVWPSLAQESAPERTPAVEEGQGASIDTPSPEPSAQEQPQGTAPPAETPAQPPAPVQSQGETPPTCDERCQAAEQREKDDLGAQQNMARFAGDLVNLTFGQVIVGAVGITLLLVTLKLTRDANKAAIRAAKAAENAVEVTRDMAKRELRAFVFGNGFELGLSIWNDEIRSYIVFVKWENAGLTPATDIHSWVRYETFPMNEDREVTFTKTEQGPPTVLGPRSTTYSGSVTIPLQTVMEKWQRQTEILVWARVEYRDTFEPDVVHHHEQCSIIDVINNPSEIPPKGVQNYVTFNVFGPQNTTG